MKKINGIVIAVALAAALVACGGDDDDSDAGNPAGTQSITKEDFLAQANAVCTAGNAEIDAAVAGITAATPEDEIAAIITGDVVGSIRGQISDMRALGYPEGDQENLESVYADADAALDEIAADPIGAFVNATSDPFEDINTRLADYGLTACAA